MKQSSLTNLDNQKAFDIAVAHLLVQNKKATLVGGACAYRAPDGAKCAVGILIPDEIYDSAFETNAWESLMLAAENLEDYCNTYGMTTKKPITQEAVDKLMFAFKDVDNSLLGSLQKVHDTRPLDKWKDGFRYVAKTFKLDTDVLDLDYEGLVDELMTATNEEYSYELSC